MSLFHPVASFLRVRQPRSTCLLHPYACLAWQGQLLACKMPWTNQGRRIALALHLWGPRLVDHKGDDRDFVVHKRLEKPWFPHRWTANKQLNENYLRIFLRVLRQKEALGMFNIWRVPQVCNNTYITKDRAYLRIAVYCCSEILVAKCQVTTLSCFQHISHLLGPFLERQLQQNIKFSFVPATELWEPRH